MMNKVVEDMLRDFPEPFDYRYRLSADAFLEEFGDLLNQSSFLDTHDMDTLCSKIFSIPYILEYYRLNYLLGPMAYRDTFVQSLSLLEENGDLESLVRCINRQSEIIKDLSSKLSKLEKLESTADKLRVKNAHYRDRINHLLLKINRLEEVLSYGKKIKTKN